MEIALVTFSPETPLTAGIITPSYRGDLECCRLLCRSIDRFADPDIRHLLIVPRSDFLLFAKLQGPRRDVITAESIQPWWLVAIPMPPPDWRKRLRLPRREILFNFKGLPVRGWIVQQIRKLAAAANAPFDLILFIDSDNVVFRHIGREHYFIDDKVRFFRNPGHANVATHNKWHHAAARLLGLPDTPYFGSDYIDPAPVWQKRIAKGLTERISQTTGMDWILALARSQSFAEYILYGVYADHILGDGNCGHTGTSQSLSFARWTGSFASREEAFGFLQDARPFHRVCNLQSTLGVDPQLREDLWQALIAAAEHQDRDGTAGPAA